MGFANTVLGWFSSPEAPTPPAQPNPNRHWKREEDNYLSQIGAMHYIRRDPMATAGYALQQNPDGSGLMMGGMPDPGAYGTFERPDTKNPLPGILNVTTHLYPDDWGNTLVHELGHAGAYATGNRLDGGYEEVRQRFTDYLMRPEGNDFKGFAKQFLVDTYGIDPDEQTPSAINQLMPYIDVSESWNVKFRK